MSSSPPTMPTQQEARSSVQLHDLERYRQTVYHGDAGRRIAESRRCSRVVRKVGPATTTYLDWVLYPTDNALSSSQDRSVAASPHHRSSESSSGATCLAKHVTSAKGSSHVRLKAAVIVDARQSIVDARQSIETALAPMRPSLHMSPLLTPPPTPRMERLPTPDLSDLDAVPFCNCGLEAHIVRFCPSCKLVSDYRSI